MSTIQVKILNWDEYQARKDVKYPSWFRLDHDVIDNPQFYDFSAEEFKAWIYLLCQASRQNHALIHVNTTHAERGCGISVAALQSAIEKLENIQVVKLVTLRARDERGTFACSTRQDRTRQDKTRQNKTKEKTLALPRFESEFLGLFESYPRKIGKTRGLKTAAREIQNPDDLASLRRAIENFCAYHARQKTEPKFVPYFSTFMNSWRDWLGPVGATQVIDPRVERMRREREEIARVVALEEAKLNGGASA